MRNVKAYLLKSLLMSSLLAFPVAVVAAGGSIAKGESLSAECTACHGSDGNSPAPSFPTIAGLGEKYLLKQLQDIKSEARVVPEMAGLLDNKSEQSLADLAAYYAAQSMKLTGSKEMQVRINSGAKVDGLELGERLYRAGNLETNVPSCSGCHSPTGQGNAPAGFPRLGGQHADYIVKQLKAFRAGERTNDGDSQVMRSIAKHMSDAEIEAVANYIAGLN